MTEVEQLKQRVAELDVQVEQLTEERRALSRLRRLIDRMPGGVLVIGQTGRITEYNPAAEALLGIVLDGKSWLEVINQCFAPRPDDGHEVSLQNGRRVSLSTQALDGEPGQLVFITDQTHTRTLQEQLHHYQRLSEMGRMMASLAHQVRTPLSAALLYASHLMSAQLDDDKRIRFAGKVKARLTHLEQQVRDMLIFARGETKLADRVDGRTLMARLEDLLDQPLTQYDADCDCLNDAPDALIQCNLEALLGAILNLINNALQACGDGCELQLRIARDHDHLLIAVSDSGPGMDAATLRQAQEPFYTTKSHGTGLGLAIAQVMARAHHGTFELDSTPGQGTRACFRLPLLTLTEQEHA
ncbi:MAG: PAS domain-containing protein [Oceanospirillales bacterium]|uniref:histidine kinase n=1 Tax=Marinobacterium halophilum TaxID=267374 RepID=A0A2P8ES94_9GAMM|nr:ATP-binding protein [Marinobacterium halophilum]MBR9827684.1 PAS domain-containing protein [Oceanospirillales bacterium]PSL12349.1 PAS/PAC sensor signal transduction histidine kinase [Marinobacterium halophilum]